MRARAALPQRPEVDPLAADRGKPSEQLGAVLGRTYAHPRSQLFPITTQDPRLGCQRSVAIARRLGDPRHMVATACGSAGRPRSLHSSVRRSLANPKPSGVWFCRLIAARLILARLMVAGPIVVSRAVSVVGMPDFIRTDLRGSRFERVDLSGAQFRTVDLSAAQFRAVYLKGTLMRGVELVDVDIHGEIENLTINGVDIGPLVNAELDRRYPDRAKMRPTDPAGFADAWDVVERLWGGTVERARKLDPELLHESVDGEWSFIETLRHLVFATDSWIRRAILGDPSPWDPLDLPWDEMPDTPGVPRDRDVRPSLDVVLELRRDRMATVRQVIDSLSDQSLDGHTKAVEGPGWPEPRSYPVRECLLVVLNEEWEHRLYAERDLDALQA